VGAHFGHKFKVWKPKALGIYNFLILFSGFVIFNLQFLSFFLQKAFFFVKKNSLKGALILYVDSRKSAIASNTLKSIATVSGISFINDLWTGGLISNFKETIYSFMSKRSFKRTTKYKRFGVRNLDFLPEIVVTASEFYSPFCVSECNTLLIPTVGVVDSNVKVVESTYPIFFNDDSVAFSRILFYLFTAQYWFGRADFALRYLGISTSFILLIIKNYLNFSFDNEKILSLNKIIKMWLKRIRARRIALPSNLFFTFKYLL